MSPAIRTRHALLHCKRPKETKQKNFCEIHELTCRHDLRLAFSVERQCGCQCNSWYTAHFQMLLQKWIHFHSAAFRCLSWIIQKWYSTHFYVSYLLLNRSFRGRCNGSRGVRSAPAGTTVLETESVTQRADFL